MIAVAWGPSMPRASSSVATVMNAAQAHATEMLVSSGLARRSGRSPGPVAVRRGKSATVATRAAGPNRNGISTGVAGSVNTPWLHSQPKDATAPANAVKTTHWSTWAGVGTHRASTP